MAIHDMKYEFKGHLQKSGYFLKVLYLRQNFGSESQEFKIINFEDNGPPVLNC